MYQKPTVTWFNVGIKLTNVIIFSRVVELHVTSHKTNGLRVHSFGMVWIRSRDEDHSGHGASEGTMNLLWESNDSMVHYDHYDPRDLGSLILIQNTS